jgi:hypothetical protein
MLAIQNKADEHKPCPNIKIKPPNTPQIEPLKTPPIIKLM